jgi:predicted transcriptional regulator
MNILQFLTPKSKTSYLETDDTVRQGLEKMRHHGYSALPVIDPKDGTFAGTVREGDFLRLLLSMDMPELSKLEEVSLLEIVRQDNPGVHVSAPLEALLDRIQDHNFVPVTDDRGCYIGIVTRKAVIGYFASHYLYK